VVWDKRHKAILSFAYLTNPLFQQDLYEEADVYGLDENFFLLDLEEVLMTMTKKRFQEQQDENGNDYTDELIIEKFVSVSAELTAFLKKGALSDVLKVEAKAKLACDIWTTSSATKRFIELSWYARRVHSMPVVTSQLERFFSHVGNVQNEKRANLTSGRASLYAAAHRQMLANEDIMGETAVQASLVNLVKQCELLETEQEMLKFDGSPGFSDLETWLEDIRTCRIEFLYRKRSTHEQARSASEQEADPSSESRTNL
jgi:uncharacterized protein (UPF0335 family)